MYILPENLLYFAPIKVSKKVYKNLTETLLLRTRTMERFIFKVKKQKITSFFLTRIASNRQSATASHKSLCFVHLLEIFDNNDD